MEDRDTLSLPIKPSFVPDACRVQPIQALQQNLVPSSVVVIHIVNLLATMCIKRSSFVIN